MRRAAIIGAGALVLAGCGSETEESAVPTYYADVAPLLQQHCAACHRAGDIAPFPLDGYEAATKHAASIKSAVVSRSMPPWPIDNSGECQTFQHARWLSQQEIDTIAAWVDGGTLEGDAAPVPPAEIDSLDGTPDVLEAKMAAPYTTPGGAADDYRCFVMELDVPEDTFITSFEVVPGNSAILHHMLGWVVDPSTPGGVDAQGEPITTGDALRTLDDETPEPGFPCYGGIPARGGGLAVTWIPGTRVIRYPEGTGFRLGKGHTMVVQTHYWSPGGAQSDQTTIRLATSQQVALPATVALLDGLLGTSTTLEPGKASVSVTWDALADLYSEGDDGPPPGGGGGPPGGGEPPDGGEPPAQPELPDQIDVYGVFPHMHQLGQTLNAVLHREDEHVCMADVTWDFDWQQLYFYETPVTVRRGERLEVTCEYDTRGLTAPTGGGQGAQDEMCSFVLFLAGVGG